MNNYPPSQKEINILPNTNTGTCPVLKSLRSNQFEIIFEYMELKDFIMFSRVCRNSYALSLLCTHIWERECLRLFTTSLPMFQLDDLCHGVSSRVYSNKGGENRIKTWKYLIEFGITLKEKWRSSNQHQSLKFITQELGILGKYVLSVLREPPLNIPELTREDFNIYLKTPFQHYISQQIFKESTTPPSKSPPLPMMEEFVLVRAKTEEFYTMNVFSGGNNNNNNNNKVEESKSNNKNIEMTQLDLSEKVLGIVNQIKKCSTSIIKETVENNSGIALREARWGITQNEGENSYIYTMDSASMSTMVNTLEGNNMNSKHPPYISRFSLPILDVDPDSGLINKEHANTKHTTLLLQIYHIFNDALKLYCKIVTQLLNQQENETSLLKEYSKRWNGFIASAEDLDLKLGGFADLLNDSYETVFPGYPAFPKYTIMRNMVLVWRQEVYSQMSQSIQIGFKNVFKAYLKKKLTPKIMKSGTHTPRPELECFFSPSLAPKLESNINTSGCSLSLSTPITTNKTGINILPILNKEMYMGCGLDSALGSISSDTYPNAPDRETQLITQFVNSIADISTNDLTVHYIGHTQFLADQPYLDLTHTVLNTSKQFIRSKLKGGITEKCLKWQHFIDSVKDVFFPSTLQAMSDQLRDVVCKDIRADLTKKIEEFTPIWKIKNPNLEELENYHDSLFIEAQGSYLGKYLLNLQGHSSQGKKFTRDLYERIKSQQEELIDLFNNLVL